MSPAQRRFAQTFVLLTMAAATFFIGYGFGSDDGIVQGKREERASRGEIDKILWNEAGGKGWCDWMYAHAAWEQKP